MRFSLIFGLLFTSTVFAQADDEWLARRGGAEVSAKELRDYIVTIPEEYRPGVLLSRKRVGEVMNGLLLNEQIVNDALAAGLENDPKVQVEFERARQRVLIQAWMQQLGEEGAQGNFEQLAYEEYLAKEGEFMTPEQVDVTHLLISTKNRDDASARLLADDLHARIVSGELDFDAAIKEHSEDPSAASNEGHFPGVRRGQMVKPFENAAFKLKEPGDFSKLVKSQFGYHIIRLDKHYDSQKLPFEQVKGQLMTEKRKELEAKTRERYNNKLQEIAPEVNEAAIQALMNEYRPVQ
jgi:peptidyl-prolyl cis-trans isomerase C